MKRIGGTAMFDPFIAIELRVPDNDLLQSNAPALAFFHRQGHLSVIGSAFQIQLYQPGIPLHLQSEVVYYLLLEHEDGQEANRLFCGKPRLVPQSLFNDFRHMEE